MPTKHPVRLLLFATLLLAGSLAFGQADSSAAAPVGESADSCSVYRVILSGGEAGVKAYFRGVEKFGGACPDQLVEAFKRLSPRDKVTHTIWILEEVKARPGDMREKIYATLLRVSYPKPAYILRPMINSYFTTYREADTTLAKQVNALHWNMIR